MDDIKQTDNNSDNEAKALLVSAAGAEVERRISSESGARGAEAGTKVGHALSGIFWLGLLILLVAIVIGAIKHFV